MAELRFDGRVALITGAGRGVGRAHALLLASRGAKVVVADYGGTLEGKGSSRGPADDVAAEIVAAGGEAVANYGSVADERDAAAMVEAAMDGFGRLDIVINNAGISDLRLFEDICADQFRQMIDVHYMGTVLVTKAAWPHLTKAGYGRVINTCSEGMLGFHGYVSAYGGAKGGVYGFTRTLAAEAARLGIRVNGIAPRAHTRLGSPESVMLTFHLPKEMAEATMAMRPPETVSPAAAFLAHESCTLNGEVLVAGGDTVHRLIVQLTPGVQSDALTPEFVADNLARIMDEAGGTTVAVNPYAVQTAAPV